MGLFRAPPPRIILSMPFQSLDTAIGAGKGSAKSHAPSRAPRKFASTDRSKRRAMVHPIFLQGYTMLSSLKPTLAPGCREARARSADVLAPGLRSDCH